MNFWVVYFIFFVLMYFAVSFFYPVVYYLIRRPISFLFLKPGKFEKSFYEKIAIRKWKNLMPCVSFGADRSDLKYKNIKNIEYLQLFMKCCIAAELVHWSYTFVGWLSLWILFYNSLTADYIVVFIVIATLNTLINLPLIFVQRYNTYRTNLLIEKIKCCQKNAVEEELLPQFFVKFKIFNRTLFSFRLQLKSNMNCKHEIEHELLFLNREITGQSVIKKRDDTLPLKSKENVVEKEIAFDGEEILVK